MDCLEQYAEELWNELLDRTLFDMVLSDAERITLLGHRKSIMRQLSKLYDQMKALKEE